MAGRLYTTARSNLSEFGMAGSHPPWCHPRWCAVADSPPGPHLSAPTGLILDDHATVTAVVQLEQHPPYGDHRPVPTLRVDLHEPDADDGVGYQLVLRPDHARGLAHMLQAAARQAAE